jgi:hypothetical protein
MPWTREQAIEYGRKGASKGGLVRAQRLSAAQRLDSAMLANAARWRKASSSELGWIDRELDKLDVIASYALKNGELNLCLKAIQLKMDGIKHRTRTRRLLYDEQRVGDRETVCNIDGCLCGGTLEQHSPQCVVRNCRCAASRRDFDGEWVFNSKHYLLRRTGPHSRYVCDIAELQRTCAECGKAFFVQRVADVEKLCIECRGKKAGRSNGST